MKKFCLALFLLPSALLFAAQKPFIHMDFSDVNLEEGIATSKEGLLEFRLDDTAHLFNDGPAGLPYLAIDRSDSAAIRINAGKVGNRFKGEELGVSFWFRADPEPGFKPPAKATRLILFGLSHGQLNNDSVEINLNVPTKKIDFDPYTLRGVIEDSTPAGEWHHIAYTYSMSNLTFKVWFNGRIQRDIVLKVEQPSMVNTLFSLPAAVNFKGAIADVKIWNYCPSEEEILSMPSASKKIADETASAFTKAANDSAYKSFKDWAAGEAKRVLALQAKPTTVSDWMAIQEEVRILPKLSAIAGGFSKMALCEKFASFPAMPISIYPFDKTKRLPFLFPFDGKAKTLEFKAAAGEYEPASMQFYPFEDIKDFCIKSDRPFVGPGGATIPASAMDIKVVKVWYMCRITWESYFAGGREYPVLGSELLLKDDSLVKVDVGRQKNYLKMAYPEGNRYVDISICESPENNPAVNFLTDPVIDAKELLPTSLDKGRFKQYFFTMNIPKDAKPGIYTGSVDLCANGIKKGEIPVSIEVYPFTLPRAATRYNIDKTFQASFMGSPRLDIFLGPGGMSSLSNAITRLRNMYENFAAHNQIHPWAITMEDPEQDDLVDIQLKIYQETGMDTNLLFGTLSECDQFWCAAMPRNRKDYPNEDISPEAHPELFKERITDHAKKVVRALDDVERRFGHRKVYCAGIDEAGPGTVRREIPFINTLLANGGKPWIDMCQAKWTSHFVAQNDTPASINRSNAMQWHEGGAEVTTYAAPFTGPANPVAWRRSKGLRLYLSNYDGINEYQFCGGYDIWNEFTTSDRYGVFSIAFYSLDGVIDTVEWEALREGFDDIRYMTLLRRLAREAMRSKNDKARRMGRLFTAWADTIDAESCDLDEIRVEAAKRIVELQKCLKELSLPTAHLSNY